MNSRYLKPASMALAAALAGVTAPHAAAFDRGQALYENQCSSCHDTQLHAPGRTRHVTTLAQLRARVAAWSIHAGLEWSDEEINDVTSYLNGRFYRFTEHP